MRLVPCLFAAVVVLIGLATIFQSATSVHLKSLPSGFTARYSAYRGGVNKAGLPPALAATNWTESTTPASRRNLGTRGRDFLDARLPLADPVSVVLYVDVSEIMLGSPSIVRLDNGLLLVVLEVVPKELSNEVSHRKRVLTSRDGQVWKEVGTVDPMWWPQVFKCTSGVYVIGNSDPTDARALISSNNLFVAKMLSPDGAQWSEPVQVTDNITVLTANQGVDVSRGRVTKPFELFPALFLPAPSVTVAADTVVPIQTPPPPELQAVYTEQRLRVPVSGNVTVFTEQQLVQTPLQGKAVFFRILELDVQRNELVCRVEQVTLWIWRGEKEVTLPKGVPIAVHASTQLVALDWLSATLSADETQDLTDPAAWTMSNYVPSPGAMHSTAMHTLLGSGFKLNPGAVKGILGFKPPADLDTDTAVRIGMGTVRWFEGWPVRLQHAGASGKVAVVYRVANDLHCSLGAVAEFDDSGAGPPVGRFRRFGILPGLATAHASVVYDDKTDLYFMVANAARDSLLPWDASFHGPHGAPVLAVLANTTCEVDRSSLALLYSRNLVDWAEAGLIDYTHAFHRHFSYPNAIIDGADLLVVSRASLGGTDVHPFYNNHNSNAISFHRIVNFRQYVPMDWLAYNLQDGIEPLL